MSGRATGPTTYWKFHPGDRYVALACSVVGSPESYEFVWTAAGPQRAGHGEAVSDGFEFRESDDFNIGVVRRGKGTQRLVAVLWMAELVDDDPREMVKIERYGVLG